MKSLFNAFAVLALFSLCVPHTVYGRKAAYLMVYFKEHGHNVYYAGHYTYEPAWCDPERTPCEAPTLWQMIDRDEWILMYDVFSARPNNMGFSSTTDFVHYTNLGYFRPTTDENAVMKTTNFSSPKHGAVIQITKKELRRLQRQWRFKL